MLSYLIVNSLYKCTLAKENFPSKIQQPTPGHSHQHLIDYWFLMVTPIQVVSERPTCYPHLDLKLMTFTPPQFT